MLQPDEVFDIGKKVIKSKMTCLINIDEKEYDDRTFVDSSDKITLPGILEFYIPEKDDFTQITITYPVDLIKSSSISKLKHVTTITYDPGEIVITKDYVPTGTDIGLLIRLLRGWVKYVKDPVILLNMLHDIIPDVDMVHLELIVSNMFRQADDLTMRCRLTGKYDNSIILGQANQPFQDSWASAMSFQYIDKAIKAGLIDGKDAEENPIEKVLHENFKELSR
jgi:hypothetical protein